VNVRQYPFKIPMNNPDIVKVSRPRHDLKELKVVEGCKSGIREERRADSPAANGSALD